MTASSSIPRTGLFGKCLVLVLSIFSVSIGASETFTERTTAFPKNIIVMIGDGCGFDHLEAARCFQYGESGGPVYMEFDRYGMSTFPAGSPGYDPEKAWSDFSYVESDATDSAAAGTAIATGVKTHNKSVGVDAEGNKVPNVTEKAEAAGRSTGIVTSVMFADATPACHVAHVQQRSNRLDIIHQMVNESAVDVIMGTGNPLYSGDAILLATPESFDPVGGPETWEGLQTGKLGGDADGDGTPDPWKLIMSRKEFQELMIGPTPKRIFGAAPASSTLQLRRSGDPEAPAFSAPLAPDMPTLAELTVGALNALDEDPDGLFLMVEGGAIDWAAHANLSGRMVEEVVSFNESIQAVADWIETHGGWEQNLLIVTADHETGHLTGPGSNPEHKPVVCKGKGVMAEMEWHSTKHTNSLVPCFVKGAGAERFRNLADQQDPMRGPYLDNTELGQALIEFAGTPYQGQTP